MGIFEFPLLRLQSRHGAEPMDDPSLLSVQSPLMASAGFSFFKFTPPAALPLSVVGLYIIFLFLQVRRKLVKLETSVIWQALALAVLAMAVQLMIHWGFLNRTFGFVCVLPFIYLVNSNLPSEHLSVENKAVLITGCDRGFGHALAKRLDQMGFRVFAGCLDKTGDGAEVLERECSERLKVLQLDITRDEDVILAAERVQTALGDTPLWGIVNNAGICMAGNSEIMALDDMKQIMEVNYWGPVRVCKAFLPMVRRARGRVVNVASNAGLAPIPLMGGYCASKSALSTMTEIWRSELQAWGVKVSTIIPSGFNTGILAYDKSKMAEKWFKSAPEVVKKDFGKDAFYVTPRAEGKEDQFLSSNLSLIVNVMVDALLAKSPKPSYHRGFLSYLLPFVYNQLPVELGDPMMKVLGDWFENKTPDALKNGGLKA